MIEKSKEKKQADIRQASSLFGYNCRDEATRTPDPYVPNVVRYQLRYIPNGMLIPHLIHKALQSYTFFL